MSPLYCPHCTALSIENRELREDFRRSEEALCRAYESIVELLVLVQQVIHERDRLVTMIDTPSPN